MVRMLLIVVALLLSPVTAYAGQDLGTWTVTRYYTPLPGQERYYNGWRENVGVCRTSNLYYAGYGSRRKGSYSAEVCMNGSGDHFITADGTDLRSQTPFAVAACPKKYLGRTLHIATIGYVVCRDTGGAIKGNRVDVWAGIGEEGYENIASSVGGLLSVSLKSL